MHDWRPPPPLSPLSHLAPTQIQVMMERCREETEIIVADMTLKTVS